MFSSQFDVSSQLSQGPDSSASPAKGRETHGVCPVTVKQISEASYSGDDKSNYVVDGVDLTNVTLVGMVFDKAERFTDVSFNLDDGTGQIGCKRWVNETFDKKEMEDMQDGMYVRIIGHLNSFQGQKQIVAFSIRPVRNFDEITFHFIQCIHVHLKNSRIKSQGDAPSGTQIVNQSQNTPVKSESSVYQTTPSNLFSAQFNLDGLKGLDERVLGFLQQPSNFEQEKGIHRDELSRQLKIPVEKIMESIRNLEEEGLIYSTIDEFHYKSTVSG